MKTINHYWALIVGAIIAFFGIIIAATKKKQNKQIDDIDWQIANNDAKLNVIDDNIDAVQTQRTEVLDSIETQNHEIADTHAAKQTITPSEPETAAEAKQNILKRVNKKSKKK